MEQDGNENLQTPKKEGLWRQFIKQIGYRARFFWTTLWLIITVVILQIPIIVASANCEILYGPAILWSLGYLMLGALLGFVFGVPTILNDSPAQTESKAAAPVQPTADAVVAGNPAAEQVVAANIAAKQQVSKRKVAQANTNLTQVSDWLTKIILGASLTQLNNIPGFIKKVSNAMAKGLVEDTKDYHFAAVFSGGIVILFLTFGFIFGYLIMRIILTDVFADVEEG